MAECDICGEEESMPYECRHCGGTFCGDHRLPESHDCPGLERWEDAGPVFDSGFDESVDPTASNESRFGIDTGPGGPLAYFRGNMTFVFLGLMWLTFVSQLVVLGVSGESTMRSLFVFTPENPLYVWTWITSIFAHGGFTHILINSIVIYFFGRLVEQYVGSKKFTLLFVGSGILAGAGQVGVQILMNEGVGVVGASGAALALMGVLTIMNPNLTVYLYFILPVPIWLLTGGTVVVSTFLIAFVSPGAGGVAHVAHLVGVVIGLLYGQQIKGKVRMPRQIQFGGGRRGPGGPGGPGRGRGPF
jgi:membrane associated rhomboid family serine protease